MLRKLMLPRSTPEAQGVSSAAILSFVDAIEQNIQDLHSFMLMRHGQVIAEGWWEPYAPQLPHMLFSLSKSFTSTAIGLLVAEGRLSVDDKVILFFPEDVPAEISPNLADMSVHDVLSMTSGHDPEPRFEDDNWVRGILAAPVPYVPGTHFVYNSMATYLCSAILQKVTGMTLLEYLRPRLFEPLGIENPTWESCPRGINVGGWGLKITTEDIAAFGQLYLQRGVWCGQQLVPASWVDAATRKQVRNDGNDLNKNPDWNQGYGYQFWRCRHNSYRGDGAFGQYCIVMPDQDAVLTITSGVPDMQAVLDVIWDRLLPAFGPSAWPESADTHTQLIQRLGALKLATVEGKPSSPLAAALSGRTYTIEANERAISAITVTFGADQTQIVLRDNHGDQTLICGHGQWFLGPIDMELSGLRQWRLSGASSSGAWTADDTYEFRAFFRETPFCVMGKLQFTGDALVCDMRLNVNFGPPELPTLRGQRA